MATPFKRSAGLLCLGFLALVLSTGNAAAIDYQTCLDLAGRDPAAALKAADDWEKAGGGGAAQHCRAAALSAMGDDKEAAAVLEQVGESLIQASPANAAELFGQAGLSWLDAGKPAFASVDFDRALQLDPDATVWLVERARAYAMQQNWKAVVADTTEALANDPNDAEALRLRAIGYRQLGELVAAGTDVERAMEIAPHNLGVLFVKAEIERDGGESTAARATLENLVAIAKARGLEDGAIAEAARAYLVETSASQ